MTTFVPFVWEVTSAVMTVPLLPDALWNLIEPLLPVPPPRPNGGRRRVPDRACLTGILSCCAAGFRLVLRVATTDKRDPDWWVIGGGTPVNLYSIRQYPDPGAAYIRQPPPICSLVSANRLSEIRTLPSRTWTVVASLVGRRRALALSRASVA